MIVFSSIEIFKQKTNQSILDHSNNITLSLCASASACKRSEKIASFNRNLRPFLIITASNDYYRKHHIADFGDLPF